MYIFLFVAICSFHLGKWIKALKQALGKSISLGMRHDRIWQEGFFDHILRSDESMAQKWEYVRENPVRAGFVTNLDGVALSRRDCELIGQHSVAVVATALRAVRARLIETRLQINTFLLRKNCKILPLAYATRD